MNLENLLIVKDREIANLKAEIKNY